MSAMILFELSETGHCPALRRLLGARSLSKCRECHVSPANNGKICAANGLKHLILRMIGKKTVWVCSKGNELIRLERRQLFVVFFLITSFQTIRKQGNAMDMHALAGIAVLLVLAAVSAYRDALRNDPMSKMNASGIRFPQSDDLE
jgi:hypothetical protein